MDGWSAVRIPPAAGSSGIEPARTVGLWRKIEFIVNDAGTLPLEARYYDRRNRLARTMRFTEVREMDGRTIPTRMIVEPHDREGHRTEFRYVEMDFDADVGESTFSLSQLERRR